MEKSNVSFIRNKTRTDNPLIAAPYVYLRSFKMYSHKSLESITPLAYIGIMEIQWDPLKNQANIKKHGLSFEEASELFELPEHLVLEIYDFAHSTTEDRIISIGPIRRGVIIVISVERDDGNIIRMISARFATRAEQKRYETVIAEVDHE